MLLCSFFYETATKQKRNNLVKGGNQDPHVSKTTPGGEGMPAQPMKVGT